jgi:hypothetical protein
LVPSPAEARRKKDVPAVAVWDLQTTNALRNDGRTWYSEIADALAQVPDVVPDRDRDFLPTFRVGEGIRIAIDTAVRRLGAGWTALRGREYDEAIALVREALDLVSPYPDERLPEGLVRDLKLLQARVQFAAGERGVASMTLQTAMALDPSWAPRREVEHPRFLELFDEVAARRSQAPTGLLTLRASVPNVRVLVHGTEQGMVYNGDLTLELPPGVYRVVGRKAGHADAVEEVRIRPKDDKHIELTLTVQNSVRFQESVQSALQAPRRQRATGVWDGLARAAAHVDARAVLVGRFIADEDSDAGGLLRVGLYLPGRGGWGCHRVIEVTDDEAETSAEVEEAILAITRSLEAELRPVYLALQE